MRLFAICITALMLLAAGCAANRNRNTDLAPSQRAAMTDPGAGWSVPPGQSTVGDPQQQAIDPAQQAVHAEAPPPAVAASEQPSTAKPRPQRKPDEGLRSTPPPESDDTAGSMSRQGRVKPLVPAFPARMRQAPLSALRVVHFAFDRTELNEEAKALLDENARWMKANPDVIVRVAGHCDERGAPEYNLALGERRARKVKDYLVSQGIAPDNLITASFGEEVPIDRAHNDRAWARNRRAAFTRADSPKVSSTNRPVPSG